MCGQCPGRVSELLRSWRASGLILACVSLVLSLGMAELVMRLVIRVSGVAYRANVLPIYEPTNDARPFALRRDFEYRVATPEFDMRIRTNDFGLRENESITSLLDHEFKILVMGDSHTFGYGVNHGERYSDLLNGILTARAIAFTSGYANGFSPIDYAAYLRGFYDYLAPDIVVVGFFPENDVVNDVRTRAIQRDADGHIVGTRLKGFTVIDGFITAENASQSKLYHRLVAFKHYLWNIFALYRLAEEARNRIRYWLSPELQNTQLPPFFFGEPSNQEEVDTTLNAIREIDRFLKANGKTLLVFFIPSNFQISARYETAVTRRPGYRASSEQMAMARRLLEPQRTFGRWFAANGIRYIDPTEDFIEADRRGLKLHFDFDGHLNRNGHHVAGRLIADYLVRHRLIPCPFLKACGRASAAAVRPRQHAKL